MRFFLFSSTISSVRNHFSAINLFIAFSRQRRPIFLTAFLNIRKDQWNPTGRHSIWPNRISIAFRCSVHDPPESLRDSVISPGGFSSASLWILSGFSPDSLHGHSGFSLVSFCGLLSQISLWSFYGFSLHVLYWPLVKTFSRTTVLKSH